MIYRLALWWDKFGTRVPFSDSLLGLTFPSEQFWGRAARASWVRENPDARLILVDVARTFPSTSLRAGSVRETIKGETKGKTNRKTTAKTTARPSAKPTSKPRAAGEGARSTRAKSICGNGEVHCDTRLRFHGLAILDVGLEVPLLHRLASRGGEDARATQNL